MNNWSLTTVAVNKFPQEVGAQASQLLTSRSIQDVCNSISKNLDPKAEADQNVFYISGKTGSGRTTFCKAILKELIQNGSVKESEILYIKIDKHDNLLCVWNCGIELARAKTDFGNIAALLASQTSTDETKLNSMVAVFDSFKVICFDSLSNSEIDHLLNKLLMSIIQKLMATNVICVSKSDNPPQTEIYGNLVKVYGLNPDVIGCNLSWQKTIQYLKASYNSTDHTIILNPKAVQLLVKATQMFGTLQFLAVTNRESPVLDVMNLIWENLSQHERVIVLQLNELRRALPLKEAGGLSRVIQAGLVEYETPGGHGNLFGQVVLTDCVQEFVSSRQNNGEMLETDSKFDVLECWKMLLSAELVELIEDAKNNLWPFVPEKWQYVKNAGKKESYNIKDLITMKVNNLPHLTHFDVLQELLHHSVLRKDYENMAAILFLIDRYIYWQGGSKTLLDIVDSIMKERPELPIAPQLVIRNARVLRTSGNLQGAEKVLDKLLNEKEKVGMWRYREEHDHQLVRGVCVQIKGEIQATLGQWYNSAVLLLDSVRLFKTLPRVDKKGLSSSLGLLVNTLQRMSVEEFQLIAQRYFLKAPHPYIQAYEFAIEAAELAIYTPLFYARHKRRAGEMMLEYSKLSTVKDEVKTQYRANALKELRESLAAHENLDSLKSREQYYEFISALYKTSCVLELENDKQKQHLDLKYLSMVLFSHYCRHQTSIVYDDMSQQCINKALETLELPSYYETATNIAGTTGSLVYPSSLSVANVEPVKSSESSLVDRCAETLETLTVSAVGSTVDRSKTTVVTIEDSGRTSGQLDETINMLKSDSTHHGLDKTNVHEYEVSSYDSLHSQWRTQRTLVYIGELLNLAEDKEGAQRDPFMVEYLSQDEPMGKYVGKKYKEARGIEQYKEDVKCQMTARYYVGLFNQELYHKRIEVSPIQFLPVVMLTLLSPSDNSSSVVYNVEPFMQGNFTKLTNNWKWILGDGSKLVLAFSHFTFERSKHSLLITDHQGWTSADHLSTTFLTDPQIHSVDKKMFGTGNLGTRGIDIFWQDMHKECNEICKHLGLTRP